MNHASIRTCHFERLNSYRNSAEYAHYAREVGADVPHGDLPSLIGNRWEIDEAIYTEFLGMLPPLAYRGNSFYLSEFTFGEITTKYSKEGVKYFCEFARWPERKQAPTETAWGPAQTTREIAPGITHYTTASHGGFHLSPERMQAIPEHLKACSFTKDEWFEEDCSWCAVSLAFPEYFSDEDLRAAQRTYDAVYRGKLTGVGAVAVNAKPQTLS